MLLKARRNGSKFGHLNNGFLASTAPAERVEPYAVVSDAVASLPLRHWL